MTHPRYARFAWAVLGYNILVIVWGAFVRATGSGAGCGDHWPMCNGQIVPRAPVLETVIEFAHRLTSGIDLVLVLLLAVWGFRVYPAGHTVRKGAALSAVFLLLEAALGAGLVLLRLVAGNQSVARAWYLALHLTNTFFLLAVLTLTARWASGGPALAPSRQPAAAGVLGVGLLGAVLVAVSGGIAALGDTLFPATTLAQGIAQDFSPSAHVFLRLRLWHPVLAAAVGLYAVATGWVFAAVRRDRRATRLAMGLTVLVLAQMALGVANVFLLAPVPLQLAHLAMADVFWIVLVLHAAHHLGDARTTHTVVSVATPATA